MAYKLGLELDRIVLWLQRVLGPVEDEHLAVYTQRCYDVGVLRLVARLVDLARVVDLLHNLEVKGSLRIAVAADFSALFVKL